MPRLAAEPPVRPSVLQPYRIIRKLFHKGRRHREAMPSALFRITPYIVFGTMTIAAAIIPRWARACRSRPQLTPSRLVGLLATARVFMALAPWTLVPPSASLGARREMMVGFLAEPALLDGDLVASLISATTSLPAISEHLTTAAIGLYPSLAFTAWSHLRWFC